jgi:hypothetical protein
VSHRPEPTSKTGNDPSADAPKRRHFLPGAIKQLFREVAKAVIQTIAPSPAARRKRQDETRKGFRMFARKITPKIVRSIFDDHAFWLPPDHDEHAEYLRLLEMSAQEDFNQHYDNGAFHGEAEHLSLHL